MAEPTTAHARPDIDIENDIYDLIMTYPPTASDRRQIHIRVQGGAVTLSGHVKTPINRRYLLNKVPQLSGVTHFDSSRLFDEETIRIDSGRALPIGVLVNVRMGTVILTGTLPEGVDLEAVATTINRLPGVERVVAQF